MKRLWTIFLVLLSIGGCAPIPWQQQPVWQDAFREAGQIAAECRAKRISGELPTYVASARCANDRMRQVFSQRGSPYMDLVDLGLAYRTALARRLDDREVSEEEAQLQWTILYSRIMAEIQRREAMADQAYSQRLQSVGILLQGLGVWQQSLTPPTPTPRGPVTCFRSGNMIQCY